MKALLFFALMGFSGIAFAEEKTCTVKGMHCEACQDMVKDRVCEGKGYEVCDIKLPDKAKNKENKMGALHIKTKDKKEKIDVAAMNKALEDTRYSVSCQ